MKLSKALIAGVAATAIAATPVMAQPQRAAAPSEHESDLNGAAWFGILAAITVVALAIVAATRDNGPVSA